MSDAFWGGALLGHAVADRLLNRKRRRAREQREQQAMLARQRDEGQKVTLPAGWAWCAGCGSPHPVHQMRPLVQGGPWFCPGCVAVPPTNWRVQP